jgi:L-cysteate sulfo-lyase
LYDTNGNALLDRLLGAKVHIVANRDVATDKIAERIEHIRSTGGKPYFIPTGGSTPVGALGYVAAAAELVEQAESRDLSIDYMVVATGSCTTHAGIVTGLEALARREQVVGITISLGGDEAAASVRKKAHETAELLGMPIGSLDERVVVKSDYLGPGYGEPTEGMIEAVELTARMEGILLDPVYTGKTMAGLIDLVRQGFFQPDQNVVFWHTGGTPALFPYEPLFPALAEDRGGEAP